MFSISNEMQAAAQPNPTLALGRIGDHEPRRERDVLSWAGALTGICGTSSVSQGRKRHAASDARQDPDGQSA